MHVIQFLRIVQVRSQEKIIFILNFLQTGFKISEGHFEQVTVVAVNLYIGNLYTGNINLQPVFMPVAAGNGYDNQKEEGKSFDLHAACVC
jgi:hypothetical protein